MGISRGSRSTWRVTPHAAMNEMFLAKLLDVLASGGCQSAGPENPARTWKSNENVES